MMNYLSINLYYGVIYDRFMFFVISKIIDHNKSKKNDFISEIKHNMHH